MDDRKRFFGIEVDRELVQILLSVQEMRGRLELDPAEPHKL